MNRNQGGQGEGAHQGRGNRLWATGWLWTAEGSPLSPDTALALGQHGSVHTGWALNTVLRQWDPGAGLPCPGPVPISGPRRAAEAGKGQCLSAPAPHPQARDAPAGICSLTGTSSCFFRQKASPEPPLPCPGPWEGQPLTTHRSPESSAPLMALPEGFWMVWN